VFWEGAVGLSALQVLELVGLAVPLFRVRKRIFLLGDVGPLAGQIGVDLHELDLIRRELVFREDGFRRALGLSQGTVDALVGVDHQKVRTLVKAVYGADLHAVRVFALNAVISNDKSHSQIPGL